MISVNIIVINHNGLTIFYWVFSVNYSTFDVPQVPLCAKTGRVNIQNVKIHCTLYISLNKGSPVKTYNQRDGSRPSYTDMNFHLTDESAVKIISGSRSETTILLL